MKTSPPPASSKNVFEKIDDPVIARRLLKETVSGQSQVMIWTKNQQNSFKTAMGILKEKEEILGAWIPKAIDAERFESALKKLVAQECYFTVTLPQVLLFFKCTYVGFDERAFLFKLPQDIYRVQRRKDFRYTLPRGQSDRVQFENPAVPLTSTTRKMVDVSAGGLGFLVGDVELVHFPVGNSLKQISFLLNGRRIVCDVVIRYCTPFPEGGSVKNSKMRRVGVQFTEISEHDRLVITTYVMERKQRMFSGLV